MKILVVGGNGMAGHVLVRYLKKTGNHDVLYTSRDHTDPGALLVDVNDVAAVEQTVRLVRPDVIINAVGVLNQYAEQNVVQAYHINGILPHKLAQWADSVSARLIHISTDCVFLGDRGRYKEEDVTDGISVYAKSKALGELKDTQHLTIRTSIIGPEIRPNGIGLLHWFLNQKGEIYGYRKVLWNGVTTLQLAKTIEQIIDSPPVGLVHLAHPETVSKYEMLLMFKEIWNKQDVMIVPDDEPMLDRTMVCTRPDANFKLPAFRTMLEEMRDWMSQV